MAWRLAKCLEVLRSQINARYPKRSKASDGTIGNEAHQSTNSDHNPHIKDGKTGVVTALDITNDPAHGLQARGVAEALVASCDKRIKYIISDGEICSGLGQSNPAWKWRPYTGKNKHTLHFHISVRGEKNFYDDETMWGTADVPPAIDAPEVPWTDTPTLRKGSSGDAVVKLQQLLIHHGAKLEDDSYFGTATHKAVVAFQKANKLVADGIVGRYTWMALRDDEATTPLVGW